MRQLVGTNVKAKFQHQAITDWYKNHACWELGNPKNPKCCSKICENGEPENCSDPPELDSRLMSKPSFNSSTAAMLHQNGIN
jgi:hypothetical protein